MKVSCHGSALAPSKASMPASSSTLIVAKRHQRLLEAQFQDAVAAAVPEGERRRIERPAQIADPHAAPERSRFHVPGKLQPDQGVERGVHVVLHGRAEDHLRRRPLRALDHDRLGAVHGRREVDQAGFKPDQSAALTHGTGDVQPLPGVDPRVDVQRKVPPARLLTGDPQGGVSRVQHEVGHALRRRLGQVTVQIAAAESSRDGDLLPDIGPGGEDDRSQRGGERARRRIDALGDQDQEVAGQRPRFPKQRLRRAREVEGREAWVVLGQTSDIPERAGRFDAGAIVDIGAGVAQPQQALLAVDQPARPAVEPRVGTHDDWLSVKKHRVGGDGQQGGRFAEGGLRVDRRSARPDERDEEDRAGDVGAQTHWGDLSTPVATDPGRRPGQSPRPAAMIVATVPPASRARVRGV